jgi:hypothetical protein
MFSYWHSFIQQRSAMHNPHKAIIAGTFKSQSYAGDSRPATLNILARIPVGEDPHEVVASTDGKTAYVCIYGGGSFHEINIIDLVAQKTLHQH